MAANYYSNFIFMVLLMSQMILILNVTVEGRCDLMMRDMIMSRNNILDRRPCEEIYVVGEGETLHTISDKCGDPFIVEENPHIQDPDDVFPGLVIKITPNHNHRY